jgi:hypothetical protein
MKKLEFLVLVVSGLLIVFSSYSFALYIQEINDTFIDKNKSVEEEKPTFLSGFLIKLPIRERPESYSIDINLSYNSGTEWDTDDDGVESKEWVVDLTVKDTGFAWNVDESNLCTRWTIFSNDKETYETVCYGSEKACNFLYLPNEGDMKWNEPLFVYPGKYGATSDNVVSAQVVYVDYSTEIDDLHADIYESDLDSLPVLFTEE